MVKMINDKHNDFGDVLIMALRYALPRRTYVTSEICDFIKQNKEHITEKVKVVMIRDITEAIDSNSVGDTCDKQSFLDLLQWLK